MSRGNERIERFYLGEMPLIKKLVDQMGWKEIFSRHIKSHGNERIPPVDALMVSFRQGCNFLPGGFRGGWQATPAAG